jgi:glycosyltransferase involved in cell wall biosynthesis
MNILVLNFEYPPLGGGASPVCHEINKRYVALGHAVTVVTMHYRDLPERENVDGVHVIRIACKRSQTHICTPYEQWTFLRQARRFLRDWLSVHRFDVVHAHFILPTGMLCRFIQNTFGIPYIITAHGSDVPGFNPDRFRFLHLWTPAMIQSLMYDAACITSPSEYLRQLIERVAPSQTDKVHVIPNGIDAASFIRSEKKPLIVSSGRLLKRKGFRELVRAVKKINAGYELHILGDGPIRKQLEIEAHASLTPVHFHGWVNNRSDAYKQLLGQATIYSLVSGRENASISILEAMASGCAVITSDASGCPEMVGDTGLLVKHGDVQMLRHAILRLVDDEALCRQLGEEAYLRARNQYNWDKIVSQYLRLLESASDSKSILRKVKN